uniref:Adipogenin n=1 Tax=Cricetulus griseus TaxID=10029 RepID=A0A8C2MWM5_CRIGR
MKYPLVPLIQRKMIQIYVSTGISGTKNQLSLSMRGHSMARRTGSTSEPALPGVNWA